MQRGREDRMWVGVARSPSPPLTMMMMMMMYYHSTISACVSVSLIRRTAPQRIECMYVKGSDPFE